MEKMTMLRFFLCNLAEYVYNISNRERQEIMSTKKEIEIVQHNTMNQLEIFMVEITAREPHGHDDLEMGILMEGEMILYTEKEAFFLHQGDIYVINRYQIHSFLQNGGRNRILAFQIRPDLYRNINPSLNYLRFESTIIHSGALYKKLRKKLLACAEAYFSETLEGELKCSALLLSAISSLLKYSHYSISSEQESASSHANAIRLNHIVDYIAAHYAERISLEDIAAMEHITSFHVSHFIKNMLGISFQQYLNQIRFEHALALFEKTALSATDICMETGFSSTRYLNKMFELHFGCGCKEYLRRERKPRQSRVALPTDNIQHRFSFEQSRQMLLN